MLREFLLYFNSLKETPSFRLSKSLEFEGGDLK